ncbi:MAG: hypothetical protein ACRBBW_03985 [Cellvibrionaceae bacterium]
MTDIEIKELRKYYDLDDGVSDEEIMSKLGNSQGAAIIRLKESLKAFGAELRNHLRLQ